MNTYKCILVVLDIELVKVPKTCAHTYTHTYTHIPALLEIELLRTCLPKHYQISIYDNYRKHIHAVIDDDYLNHFSNHL